MLEKSSTSYLGPGDRGFKSRSPDQNRQFSSRKPAVLTFLKGFSLFIAAQFLTSLDGTDISISTIWKSFQKISLLLESCAFSFS